MSTHISHVRPHSDRVLTDIADYVVGYQIKGKEAYNKEKKSLNTKDAKSRRRFWTQVVRRAVVLPK